GRRLHAFNVILGHVQRTPRAVVTHEQRTTIDGEIRTQLAHGRLENLATVERTTNRLRDAVGHRLALGLLGQRVLRPTAFGDVNADTGDIFVARRVHRRKLEHQPVMRRAVFGRNGFDNLFGYAA